MHSISYNYKLYIFAIIVITCHLAVHCCYSWIL